MRRLRGVRGVVVSPMRLGTAADRKTFRGRNERHHVAVSSSTSQHRPYLGGPHNLILYRRTRAGHKHVVERPSNKDRESALKSGARPGWSGAGDHASVRRQAMPGCSVLRNIVEVVID